MAVIQLISLILATALFGTSAVSICRSDQIACGDESSCISPSSLCDYVEDCSDGSDEIIYGLCKILSKHKQRCTHHQQVKCESSSYQYSYLSNQCMDVITACSLGRKCLSSSDFLLCDFIKGNKLNSPHKKRAPETENAEEEAELGKLVRFLSDSLNASLHLLDGAVCPPFYTQFGDACVSAFTPIKVSWAEAKIFCESILGELAIIDENNKFIKVLEFLKKNNISSSFWLGGRYHRDNSSEAGAWTWLDGQVIQEGAPYWAITFPRTSSSQSENKCMSSCDEEQKQLAPSLNQEGQCLSIHDGNFYYFSDEFCVDKRSPFCVAKQIRNLANKTAD